MSKFDSFGDGSFEVGEVDLFYGIALFFICFFGCGVISCIRWFSLIIVCDSVDGVVSRFCLE